MEEIYYKTPLGIVQIVTDGINLNRLSFVNSQKGHKVDETSLLFEEPQLPITKQAVQQLNEYFNGTRSHFDLPISQAGTDFQQQVWSELLNIPFGKTISYLELSKRLGNVKAIRAAGTANGNNRVAIVVPCHRVIGSDGTLVGYGGELWRKKWLLDHEAKWAHGVQSLFS